MTSEELLFECTYDNVKRYQYDIYYFVKLDVLSQTCVQNQFSASTLRMECSRDGFGTLSFRLTCLDCRLLVRYSWDVSRWTFLAS